MVVWTKNREFLKAYADGIRPDADELPSEFALRERVLHEVYCSERPGPWDQNAFPYQAPVMDTVGEAIRAGKRGVVFMKAGQIGGTDCMINAQLWLKKHFPGPQLFMTATEKVAGEFGRERFELVIRDMPSMARRYRPNARGDILTKRFTDGKIQLCGGQSVFNLQSTPYRVVVIDELDSLNENLGGSGDPVKLAEVRTDSFTGQTLMIAYAHPSVKERGAAKIYFEQSDQRRGFVRHSCGGEFYLQWEHVHHVNERDPETYAYFCPACGAQISDAERAVMVRKVEYRSVLSAEAQRGKAWIGVHASQLYSPAKTIRSFAQRWVDAIGDENVKRVFYNKVLGEPYEAKVKSVEAESLRALVVVNRRQDDPEFYLRGQVPPMVRFLTAGQDSRTTELHYAVWGWGLRRAVDKTLVLCGWLIDWGCIKRPHSLVFSEADYHVFDDIIYRRRFQSSAGDRFYNVVQCGHDISYEPTQLPIIRFARSSWPERAIPVRGAAIEASSSCRAPYAAWGVARRFHVGDQEHVDGATRALNLNTFMLKTDWYGWVDQRVEVGEVINGEPAGTFKAGRLTFPHDMDDAEYLKQSKNESLCNGPKSELIWKKTGPNHYADCNIYALGLALNLDPFQKDQTAEEYAAKRTFVRPRPVSRGPVHDPMMG